MNNNIDDNPIMAEVYANRREISERFGNDPKRYISAIREMKRRAAEAAEVEESQATAAKAEQ